MENGLIRFVGDDCKKALYDAIEARQVRPGLCKAAGLCRAQPRILRGAHDVRVGKLCRCDQQLTRTGIRQLRQPVLHRDAGCVRERTDVLVADDHVDLPLRLLNTDPDAEQPEGR